MSLLFLPACAPGVEVKEGSKIKRSCESNADAGFTVSRTDCIFNYSGDHGDPLTLVEATIEGEGGVFIYIRYEGQEPGSVRVDGSDDNKVRWYGECRAESEHSREPCVLELLELVRGSEEFEINEYHNSYFEPGSSLRVRMSCPEEMLGLYGDYYERVQQSPQVIEFEATDCRVN